MSYTPHIIPAIPSDIAAERHAAIAAKFYEINAAMLQFSCAKKADAVAHAAIALSKSGSGACGYASAVSAISAAAAAMGRKGGKSKSAAKKSAVRENGKKGGRPTAPALIEYAVTCDGETTQHSEWVMTSATSRAGLVASLKKTRRIDGRVTSISRRPE